MAVLERLEPKKGFGFFEEMCAIPHGSGNTKAVSDWLMEFANARGLEAHQDALGNVIMVREASPGYEAAEPVILQGHMDMVCQQAPECNKDMEREGLDLRTDGESVWAEGTTLGGDDGIAVAMALAVLDDDAMEHPRVEAVFTVDEEIGMLGAAGIDAGSLRGRRMVNLDSEDEGIFTVSCAGGNMTRCVLPVGRTAFGGETAVITVDGLQGGHSGMEIGKGRGNADLLLGRALYACARATDLRIVSVSGGLKDNAIPQTASAVVSAADVRAVETVCARLDAELKNEAEGVPMDGDSTRRVTCLLACAPNGVQEMSRDIPGLVQTSLNLGVLTTAAETVSASFCVRSSVDSQKAMLTERLACLPEQLGGAVEVSGDYAAWQYRPDSPLRELMTAVFTEQYGHPPKVEAIHAGVECGLFAGKLPGLDCVSIGPDLREIHTCRERMDVASVQRTWRFLTELLRRMK